MYPKVYKHQGTSPHFTPIVAYLPWTNLFSKTSSWPEGPEASLMMIGANKSTLQFWQKNVFFSHIFHTANSCCSIKKMVVILYATFAKFVHLKSLSVVTTTSNHLKIRWVLNSKIILKLKIEKNSENTLFHGELRLSLTCLVFFYPPWKDPFGIYVE